MERHETDSKRVTSLEAGEVRSHDIAERPSLDHVRSPWPPVFKRALMSAIHTRLPTMTVELLTIDRCTLTITFTLMLMHARLGTRGTRSSLIIGCCIIFKYLSTCTHPTPSRCPSSACGGAIVCIKHDFVSFMFMSVLSPVRWPLTVTTAPSRGVNACDR